MGPEVSAEGRRRALQWLRLRSLGDQDGAQRLLDAVDAADGWLWVTHALQTLVAGSRMTLNLLGIPAAPEQLAAYADLKRRINDAPRGTTDWRQAAHEVVSVVEQLAAQHIPDPTRRLDFYEQQARAAYEAGG